MRLQKCIGKGRGKTAGVFDEEELKTIMESLKNNPDEKAQNLYFDFEFELQDAEIRDIKIQYLYANAKKEQELENMKKYPRIPIVYFHRGCKAPEGTNCFDHIAEDEDCTNCKYGKETDLK